jgi:hypothetical protein
MTTMVHAMPKILVGTGALHLSFPSPVQWTWLCFLPSMRSVEQRGESDKEDWQGKHKIVMQCKPQVLCPLSNGQELTHGIISDESKFGVPTLFVTAMKKGKKAKTKKKKKKKKTTSNDSSDDEVINRLACSITSRGDASPQEEQEEQPSSSHC